MDATLIECILKRDGGTKIDLGGMTYHFAPDPEGRHVAMVADPDHISRLLSIPEGYRLPRASTSIAAQTAVSAPIGAVAPTPAPIQTTVPKVEVEQVKLPADDNGEGEGEGQSQGESAEAEQADTGALDSMSKEQLAEVYLAKVGQKAHPAMSAAKMIEKIKAASAA